MLTSAKFFGILSLTLAVYTATARAQDIAGAQTEEIVVNLSTGRVLIAVVKDAILIGTVESPVEQGTHPPIPISLGSERAGIVLGAVDWMSISRQKNLARLDTELPKLHSTLGIGGPAPHLSESQGGDEAADIEAVGQGLLERLNNLSSALHEKLEMPSQTPIAQVVIADYLANYGAEVWQFTYSWKQSQQKGEYWSTSVSRPVYLQFYPPEKNQPKTLMEFDYPPQKDVETLLSLLQKNDSKLVALKNSDPKMAQVFDLFLKGESTKVLPADGIQFIRAAMDVIAPPNSRQTMLEILPEKGLQWLLAPPEEPKEETNPQQPRPPGAPTLVKPPSLRQ